MWVKDASRAVGVAQRLISPDLRCDFVREIAAEYQQVRDDFHARHSADKLIPLEAARANRLQLDWASYTPPKPNQIGDHIFTEYDLAELRPYIDWTPFFHTWEMKGRYPQILDDADKGEEARKLWADAQAMLDRIIAENWLEARAEVSLFAANSVGDDIEVRPDDEQDELIGVLHCLRQQKQQPAGKPNLSLADYIAPKESGKQDWIGLFACTAGIGIEEKLAEFKKDNDDYSSIMLKALADRLAEAFAERLHQLVRKELWGYATDEQLNNDALIEERYQGIRPAPGYPACPDHTEKGVIWGLAMIEEDIGITLTESYAMNPAASVSGLYFAHPEAKYFALGKIGRDQVESYASRKGMGVEEVERWLAPNLGYDA